LGWLVQIRLEIPERCQLCGAQGSVVPEHIIRGNNVTLNWSCNICGKDWAISVEEQRQERRNAERDRRAQTRGGDRRQD
jgi:hypothetical protein